MLQNFLSTTDILIKKSCNIKRHLMVSFSVGGEDGIRSASLKV